MLLCFPLRRRRLVLALLVWSVFAGLPAAALAQRLRIATWNVTNYTSTSSDRDADIATVLYGAFQGRSLSPDILIGQEFTSTTAQNNFVRILNTTPGSPGDWAAAPFRDGPDSESVFFYRASQVLYLGTTTVAFGSSATNNQPRNTYRYDVRLIGLPNQPLLACYSVHMKAGDTTTDQARRLVEAQRIRANAQTLPPGVSFLVAGDFNIQSSAQTAYQTLVGVQSDNRGRCFDPIRTPGTWNNSFTFRFVHTQDPIGPGGMDDRLDQILVGGDLVDGVGLDYRGDPNRPYNAFTWNDPYHSYRVWGNDGTSYNNALTTTGNQMVGPAIAQALQRSADGAGHLPVFLEIVYRGLFFPKGGDPIRIN